MINSKSNSNLGKKTNFLAIGLMSGTSMDGIDLSLIETNGDNYIKHIGNDYFEYSVDFKNRLRSMISGVHSFLEIKSIENEITVLHADLVNKFLNKNKINHLDIDLLGFHGQTIFHAPEKKITWQIGNAQLLAQQTKIKVVADFRVQDVLQEGQGAPLVPIYHFHLFKNPPFPKAILNIGGVSNVTYFDDNIDSLTAFDVCFGNAPFDDLMQKNFQKDFDENGQLASKGEVDFDLSEKILSNEIFDKKPPKSYSRNDFVEVLSPLKTLTPENSLASLSYIFAKALKKNLEFFDKKPKEILLCGGGRKNKTLLNYFRKELGNISVRTTEEVGFNGSSIEAEAFAFLAVRRALNLPISFNKTTGVNAKNGCVGGVIFENLEN